MLLNKIILLYYKFKMRMITLLLIMRGARLEQGVRILGVPTIIGSPANLTVGTGTTINVGVVLNLRSKITIGKHVALSPYCQLHTGTLDLQKRNGDHRSSDIFLADNTWVASGAVILPNVVTRPYEVIPANSVRHPKTN